MALKTTIPTLEIKTSGTDLSLVDTLYITIKRTDFQTVKSNDDIEVDNDLISVSLSEEEAAQLADGGGANVSIMAVGADSTITTVRVTWVRRGSRTNSTGGGGGSGGESDMLWYPFVSSDGDLTWSKKETEAPPMPVNIKGEQGIPGKDGADGFSPVIEPNDENDEETYKLDITTGSGAFTTPNLKGPKGDSAGESGGLGLYAFEIRDDGHLYLLTEETATSDNFTINSDGHLIYTF